uniref:Uncharacterized protein n=1 Tax=Arundo donax TaxID=35708 RepID=A0A0A9DMT4_ARUDO
MLQRPNRTTEPCIVFYELVCITARDMHKVPHMYLTQGFFSVLPNSLLKKKNLENHVLNKYSSFLGLTHQAQFPQGKHIGCDFSLSGDVYTLNL